MIPCMPSPARPSACTAIPRNSTWAGYALSLPTPTLSRSLAEVCMSFLTRCRENSIWWTSPFSILFSPCAPSEDRRRFPSKQAETHDLLSGHQIIGGPRRHRRQPGLVRQRDGRGSQSIGLPERSSSDVLDDRGPKILARQSGDLLRRVYSTA